MVPDLEGVEPTEDVLFSVDAGDITGLDLIYGFRKCLETMPYMAHKNGFTAKTLTSLLSRHFERVKVQRLKFYNLLGVGS
jgi:hypothetical protein